MNVMEIDIEKLKEKLQLATDKHLETIERKDRLGLNVGFERGIILGIQEAFLIITERIK